jgi:hypothetical protein
MQIRQAEQDDIAAIHKLFEENAYLEEKLTASEFQRLMRWLFLETPLPIHHQLVAVEGPKVVAHYGMVPFTFKRGNSVVNAGLGSTLLIDSHFRNGLLFFSLQSQFLRGFSALGIDFVYGLVTRPKVLETHLKTGYERIGLVPVYAKPFRTEKVLKRKLGASLGLLLGRAFDLVLKVGQRVHQRWRARKAKGISVDEVKSFPSELDELVRSVSSNFEIEAQRGVLNLNWRFTGLPHRGYRLFLAKDNQGIAGYLVLRKMPMQEFDTVAVVDFLWTPGRTDVARALLAKVDQMAREWGSDLAATLLNPHSPFLNELRGQGFLKTPESFTLVVSQPRNKEGKLTPADFTGWHLSWFDHDTV